MRLNGLLCNYTLNFIAEGRCKYGKCNEEEPNPNKTISQPTSTESPPTSQIIITGTSQITTTKFSNSSKSNRTNSVEKASSKGRSSSESWNNFKYGALAGCGVMLLIIFLIAVCYCIICRKSKTKRRKGNYCKLVFVITNI